MPEPAISVLMSVYNGEQFLAPAIESILVQSLTDFDFLILDDGSSDSSWSILQDYAGRDDRIRLIRRENKGLIVSLNELIAAATAPLLARMDCDDISMPDRFTRQVAFLEANPDYGVVGSQRVNIDEQGQELPMAGPDYALDHQQFLSNIGTESLLCHSSVMMRRDMVQAVGGYHAAFRHCEDFDLWLRLSNLTKLCSMPEKLVCYRHSADQVSKRHLTEQQIGTAVALAAYHERNAGRPDPTEALTALPPLDKLDALFGRQGMEKEVLAFVIPHLRYSKEAMQTDGLKMIGKLLQLGGNSPGLWRTVIRLVLMAEPLRALQLFAMISTHSVRKMGRSG
ncbi:MAG: glycosyltransferase [Sphingomonadales bacterium]|nr:glycosyltransferase [Sphingomonadales bacterium]